MNNTTISSESDVFQEYYYYDEQVYGGEFDSKRFFRIMKLFHDLAIAVAIICGLFGLSVLLSLFREDIRRRSVIWYTTHLIVAIAIDGLFFHMLWRSRLHKASYKLCLFMTYGTEYIVFMSGYNLILINLETIFTILFPHRLWETKKVLRFATSILIAWIAVLICVSHVIIHNNKATSSSYFCMMIRNKEALMLRLVFRNYIPTSVLSLLTITAIGLHYLQQKRATMATNLRPIDTLPVEWLRYLVTVNIVYILPNIVSPVTNHLIPPYLKYMYLHWSIHFFKSVSFYFLPLPLLLVGEIRTAICEVLKRTLERLRARRDDPFKDIQSLTLSGVISTNQE